MNKLHLGSLLVCMGVCSGCISSHLAWVEGVEPDVPQSVSANCRFTGDKGPASLAAAILNANGNPNGEALELSLFVETDDPEPANGLLAKVNNIASFCTVGIWPWVRSQKRCCTLELVGYGEKVKRQFVIGHRTWSSFILPIGIIPCPGWSNWRSSATFSLDFERGPKQKAWEAALAAAYAGELLTDENLKRFENRRNLLKNPATPSKAAPAP